MWEGDKCAIGGGTDAKKRGGCGSEDQSRKAEIVRGFLQSEAGAEVVDLCISVEISVSGRFVRLLGLNGSVEGRLSFEFGAEDRLNVANCLGGVAVQRLQILDDTKNGVSMTIDLLFGSLAMLLEVGGGRESLSVELLSDLETSIQKFEIALGLSDDVLQLFLVGLRIFRHDVKREMRSQDDDNKDSKSTSNEHSRFAHQISRSEAIRDLNVLGELFVDEIGSLKDNNRATRSIEVGGARIHRLRHGERGRDDNIASSLRQDDFNSVIVDEDFNTVSRADGDRQSVTVGL